MSRVSSVAARSGILVLTAFVLMSAIWCALMPGAPLQHRIDAFFIMLAKPAWWAMPLLGWMGLFAWMRFGPRTPASQSLPMQMVWWIGATLAAAIAMVALTRGVSEVNSLLHGMSFPSTWRSMLRLFEAALLAVIVVRFALPLIPRFDRMPPRNA